MSRLISNEDFIECLKLKNSKQYSKYKQVSIREKLFKYYNYLNFQDDTDIVVPVFSMRSRGNYCYYVQNILTVNNNKICLYDSHSADKRLKQSRSLTDPICILEVDKYDVSLRIRKSKKKVYIQFSYSDKNDKRKSYYLHLKVFLFEHFIVMLEKYNISYNVKYTRFL